MNSENRKKIVRGNSTITKNKVINNRPCTVYCTFGFKSEPRNGGLYISLLAKKLFIKTYTSGSLSSVLPDVYVFMKSFSAKVEI